MGELNELALGEDEYQQIEEEHKRLSNSGDIAMTSQAVVDLLCDSEESNTLGLLTAAQQRLNELATLDNHFFPLAEMLEEARIQTQETSQEISRYLDQLDMDPQRLQYLDDRMGTIMSLSRKHHVQPEALYSTHQQLIKELEKLAHNDEAIEQLQAEVDKQFADCLDTAEKTQQKSLPLCQRAQ